MKTKILRPVVVLLVGFAAMTACDKPKPVPIVDAAPPAPAPTPVAIAPLEEDAGSDVDANEAAAKPGVFVDPKVARIKQCCGALRGQAKALGPSPESGLFTGAAAQCDAIAAQAGAKGTAPELAFLRTLRTIPPVCQGL